jgi:hypothetical protein
MFDNFVVFTSFIIVAILAATGYLLADKKRKSVVKFHVVCYTMSLQNAIRLVGCMSLAGAAITGGLLIFS